MLFVIFFCKIYFLIGDSLSQCTNFTIFFLRPIDKFLYFSYDQLMNFVIFHMLFWRISLYFLLKNCWISRLSSTTYWRKSRDFFHSIDVWILHFFPPCGRLKVLFFCNWLENFSAFFPRLVDKFRDISRRPNDKI